MSLTLTCKDTGDFKPHPEGIHPAVCVDVMDLGLVETEFQGQKKMVNKVKVTFESEALTEDGIRCTVSKNFTASLHPKAKLAEFLGKWRGRPVLPGESIDLQKLLGANCTLVISHQQSLAGKTYASIDAVSKPTKKVAPSGQYDPLAARQRYAEWCLRTATGKQVAAPLATAPATTAAAEPRPVISSAPASEGQSKSNAGANRTGHQDFDPEVGF
jgi:hypothetical protein